MSQNAILNFDKKDPFADDLVSESGQGTEGYVHIRVQQRNGRKAVTTIQGLPNDLDLKKILKALKKEFCCNGCIVEHKDLGKIIQLTGDQRQTASNFLVKEEIITESNLKIHGF